MIDAASKWAWAQTGLTPHERLILLALVATAKGQFCFPHRGALMEATGMDVTEVISAVQGLGAAGLIRRMDVEDGSATYLNMPKAPKPRASKALTQVALLPSNDLQLAVDLYNEMAKRIHHARVTKITPTMKAALSVRLKEGDGLASWRTALVTLANSAHCRGLNDRGWKADLHYMLTAKGYGKLINGGWPADYEERSNGGQRTKLAGRGDVRAERIRGLVARNHSGHSGRGQHGGFDGSDRARPDDDGGGPIRIGDGSAAGIASDEG